MGMLAKRPMQKEVKAEMAAVAVTRSRLTTATQRRYSSFVSHRSAMLSAGQTQVPPESARMVAEYESAMPHEGALWFCTVDRDDVGHSEEGSKTSAEFSEEAGILAFLGLHTISECIKLQM